MMIERVLGSLCVLLLLGCSSNGVPAGLGGAAGAARERTGSAAAAASPAVSVLTYHNNIARTGLNANEGTLNWTNVNQSQFGRLFTLNVDDNVYAQPLVTASVTFPGGAVHNALYVATASNSLYVFDADTGAQIKSWSAGSPIPASAVLPEGCRNIYPNIGITGTPVIDAASSTIYFVTAQKTAGGYAQYLNALDITTLTHKFGSPRAIAVTVPGDGPESVNGVLAFDPARSLQRPGLLLQNDVVYVAWGSHCDDGLHFPTQWFHGWAMGFAAQSLSAAPAVLNTSPHANSSYPPCTVGCLTSCSDRGAEPFCNAACCPTICDPGACTANCVQEPYGGSIWQGGGGLAADANFLYATTANGVFNPAGGGFGDSTLAIPLGNPAVSTTLSVMHWFTPYDQSLLDKKDWDLGAGGVVLLDGLNVPNHAHLLVSTGKSGTIYLLDRDTLSSPPGPLMSPPTADTYCTAGIGSDNVVAEDRCAVGMPGLTDRDNAFFGVPAYFYDGALGHLYFGGDCDTMKAFAVGNISSTSPHLSVSPEAQSADPIVYPYPGVVPSVSASGTTNAIVWAVRRQSPANSCNTFNSAAPSALIAYKSDTKANTLTVLYDSSKGPVSDGPGAPVQFTTPTIANGKVYVGGKQAVTVYGLSPSPACSTATCPTGCCKNGVCMTTQANAACGSNGAGCVACGPNEICTGGASGGACTPLACGPSTPCAVGCCYQGQCVTSNECHCGADGTMCAGCPTFDAYDSCIAGVCQAPAYQGWLDRADCTLVAGWTEDAHQPDTPTFVTMRFDGYVATLEANGFRQDLLNAGLGNGYHAFGWAPGLPNDGSTHTVSVKFAGTNIELSGSPKTFTCGSCNASTCPNGCCQNGVCTTPSNNACGINGAACASCLAGSTCTNGVCQSSCGPSTCPNGCCQNGTCVTPSASACGSGGATCKPCPGGWSCTNGACKGPTLCNAASCPLGCCLNGVCTTPSNSACGTNGAGCVACAAGQTCTNGTCTAAGCSAATCPNGCCQGGSCTTPSSSACGTSGAACVACAAGQTCTGGACQACGVCVPGATQTVACGNCGTRTDTCNSSCQWTQGMCTGQGVCAPGDQQPCCSGCSGGCGCQGSMTCQSSCTWGSCKGSICKPGSCP